MIVARRRRVQRLLAGPVSIESVPAALGNQRVQVAPAVCAVELAAVTIETFCAECLIEAIGRIRSLPKEKHGGNATAQKLTRHLAEQQPTDALALNALKRVDLVQLPGKARHAAIVRCSLRECDELAIVVLDDETKPTAVRDR